MSPFDRWLFRRTLGAAALGLAAATLVAVATDESASTAGMRLARAAALVPAAAAVATLSVVAHARGRGEARAVGALGMSPWEAVRGARTAALLFGLLTPLCLMLPSADTRSLFPSARPTAQWTIVGGAAIDVADGVRISPDGGITLLAAAAPGAKSGPGRWAALMCLWPLSLVVPSWAVTPMAVRYRFFSVLGAAAISVLTLHALAAGRVGAWAGILATFPLLLAVIRERARH